MTEPPGAPDPGDPVDDPTAVFTAHRALLFTIAYEMLGSAADAEDVVQDVWVRWSGAAGDPDGEQIRHPRAYLARITTRLALNRLRTLSRQREDYVGPWLPEPLLTAPDLLDNVLLTESVSMAMLVVLETLTPRERAVFLLREVFGFDHDEIGVAVGCSAAAARQTAHRAREHVRARRPRFDPDPAALESAMAGFLGALGTGDLQALMDLMAPDVVLLSDGGGKRQAARRPLHGADPVSRFLLGVVAKNDPFRVELRSVNGAPGWLVHSADGLDSVVQLVVSDGRIAQVLFVRNPDKLAGAGTEHPLAR
ncbi:RNA polymerase sigma-70 factor [Nakamurella flavida]|uniref:RNA polymerase sigma-70 factor n=1 Tax=Nakamurella flavida TaxID=363630 RepID=A0A938YNF2_9ACTN|nr:RNA polymerase sigma-70 factor [Nakamurella flavida]MBM9478494.1 RNA polymerase sigma-70 factor [Nakamurella flavida]MDP9777680.1 RNA polymerase sigma-70 factor (ECF subfamily) [Nakamurella flavida]